MTAVIIAPDKAAAREAAFNLGLRHWSYPLSEVDLGGIVPDLVVYVEGWRTSAVQTVAVGEAVELRAQAHGVERIVEQPRMATMLTGARDARHAQEALDWLRPLRAKAKGSPFVSPESVQALTARPRPRSFWARLTRRVRRG